MKKRIKIDTSILSFAVVLTGFLFLFPRLYLHTQWLDNVLDFFGIIAILKGNMVRMISRGHKKANSDNGKGLVITGIYSVVRNPMYLGSFMIGCGFVLILWPWWSLPLFSWLFYSRFKRQVVKEEKHLSKLFGKEYEVYCWKVPRVFPSWQQYREVKLKNIFILEEVFSTKETRGLFLWPLATIILESVQQMFVLGDIDLYQTVVVVMFASVVFVSGWILSYQESVFK